MAGVWKQVGNCKCEVASGGDFSEGKVSGESFRRNFSRVVCFHCWNFNFPRGIFLMTNELIFFIQALEVFQLGTYLISFNQSTKLIPNVIAKQILRNIHSTSRQKWFFYYFFSSVSLCHFTRKHANIFFSKSDRCLEKSCVKGCNVYVWLNCVGRGNYSASRQWNSRVTWVTELCIN